MDSNPDELGRREATDGEVRSLRHVVDPLPTIVWIALVAGSAERFTFYAVSAPWQNYMQNPADSIAVPGALGLGQATATNISNAFFCFSFLAPLVFGILSDARWGRYKTLCIGFWLEVCGCLVLFTTSLPQVTSQPGKLAGLAVALVLLGLGTGAVKATVSPFIGDQYTNVAPQLLVTKKGERVIADRTLTIQYIYNVFYWFTNIGSLSLIASTYLEKKVGFWAAYLLPLCSSFAAFPLLLFWRNAFVKPPPQGNVLPQAARVIAYSARDRFRLDAAKPAFQKAKYNRTVTWTDLFVFEIQRGLKACKVMACFVPFYLCMNQITNNLVSQAGQTRLGGFSNDTVQAFSPIACVLLGPIVQKLLYPLLQKHSIPFGPIARMTWAFITMGAAMGFAAGLQKLIYTKGPCYQAPLDCPASDGGSIPNDVSVWVQTPVYFLIALAEILGFVTLSEYSYSKAPKDMRTVVQALRQMSAGLGSVLGMAMSPVSVDPKVMYLYTGLAVTMALAAPGFWIVFRGYDKIDEKLNGLEPMHSSEGEELEPIHDSQVGDLEKTRAVVSTQ